MAEPSDARNSGLGVFIPEYVGEIIDVWRRLYDPSINLLTPHITLAYPPFVSPEEWPQVKPAVIACLADFGPFRVTLKEVGIFQGDPHVLWLKPEDGGILVQMRLALETSLPKYVPPLPFVFQPHISVGFFEAGDEASLQRAREKILAELKPVEFQVDQISYAFQNADGLWQTHDRIHLDRDSGARIGGEKR